jgi:hypothetical protein
MESIRKIYGADMWERDPLFRKAQGGEFTEGNIASASMKEGSKIRKLMSAPFGRKYLLDQQAVFKSCVDKTMDEIVRLGSLQDDGGAVDLYNVARVYAFMVVGTLSRFWFFLTVDVVAVGGCYKPEGQTITMEEIDTAKKAPLGLVFIPHWTNLANMSSSNYSFRC